MTDERDQRQQPVTSRIPDFASREDEAASWDTHDVTEFIEETRPVKLRVGKTPSEGLAVRLDRRDREDLERRAGEQGIGPSTPFRMWIKERLRGTQTPSWVVFAIPRRWVAGGRGTHTRGRPYRLPAARSGPINSPSGDRIDFANTP